MSGKKPTKPHDMRTLEAKKNYGNTANRNVVHGIKPVVRKDAEVDTQKKEGEQDA